MNTIHYRLVLNGLMPGAEIKKIAGYFQKDMELSQDQIHALLSSTPRVLKEFTTHHSAEIAQSFLSKSGCIVSLDPIVTYPLFPFYISQRHEIIIKKELSKVLRCRTSLSLLLAQVAPTEPRHPFPSMLGPFEEQVMAFFRESDTIIGMDDRRLIILGFATDKKGVTPIKNKAQRVLKQLLGHDISVTFGYSVFPEDGQTIAKLMYLAAKPRKEAKSGDSSDALRPAVPTTTGGISPEIDPSEAITPIELCFTQARGRILKRLLNMDPRTLWLGISRIPQSGQKEFMVRLPFDSALTMELDRMINTPSRPVADQSDENHFCAVIHQMELETHMAKRDILMQQVLLKLNQSEDLPTLPSVATQIFDIASNPNTSGAELAAIVTKDPALTSKLLKTVNSAFYGNPQKISSVKHAIVLLGMEEIVDIAFGLAAAKVFDIKPRHGILDPKTLWHHAISTALIAQSLGKKIPQFREFGIFTAGLLHDVGKIFLIANYPDPYLQLSHDADKLEMPLFEMEEDHFGIHHAMIGKYLSSQWNLPEVLANAIAYHHQPYNAPSYSAIAAITGLADYLYYRSMGTATPPYESPPKIQWLTVGHWTFLAQLFQSLNSRMLDDMTRDAEAIMEEHREYMDFLR